MVIKRIIVLATVFLCCPFVFSQTQSDAERLSRLEYMKHSKDVDCNKTNGTSIEQKTCLNLEFQKTDSLLNSQYEKLLNKIKEDPLKDSIIQFQNRWVLNRRIQAKLVSRGLDGHALGIQYLQSMVQTTKSRTEEIKGLLEQL